MEYKNERFDCPGDAVGCLLTLLLTAAEEGGLKKAETGRMFRTIMDSIEAAPGNETMSKFGEIIVSVTGGWLKHARNSDPIISAWIDNTLAETPKATRKRRKKAA